MDTFNSYVVFSREGRLLNNR
ncbi:hypothetical protein LCGC14_2863430, partial [marine sediment metagenome]